MILHGERAAAVEERAKAEARAALLQDEVWTFVFCSVLTDSSAVLTYSIIVLNYSIIMLTTSIIVLTNRITVLTNIIIVLNTSIIRMWCKLGQTGSRPPRGGRPPPGVGG